MKLKIFKIGGTILDEPENLKSFLKEFSGIPDLKILVHGGGKLASAYGRKLGLEEKYVDGRRITDSSTLELVTMVYGGLINKNLVAQLESLNCPSVGLSGADGSSLVAHKRNSGKIDFGWAGDLEPENFNLKLIKTCLFQGFTPVFSSLSFNPQGSLLNTNADTIASSLGGALSRDFETEVYFCFDKIGVQDKNQELIPSLNDTQIQELILEGAIKDGMLPKIQNALNALKSGVKLVYILGSDFYRYPLNESGPFLGTKIIL